MKIVVMILGFGLFFSPSVFSSESDLWNYFGLSRVHIEADGSNEYLKGFALDSKLRLNESFFFSGKYQRYSITSTDVDRILFGFGGKYEMNPNISPFAQVDYVYIKSKNNASEISIKYWILGLGIVGSFNQLSYKLGISHYEPISDNAVFPEETGRFAEVYYSANNSFSFGIELESVDNDHLYNLGFRYHF